MKDEMITARLVAHHEYLKNLGYDVVCTMLQGSQNYGLDEYTNEYMSDVDTKSIVLPSLDEIVRAAQPVSAVEVMENNEHAEVKDVRVMFDMFKKMNISYIELLYSKYIYIEPKWEVFIKEIFEQRNLISSFNKNQFLKCIAGMAYEKQKALCHPYPGVIDKINKYGYDGKQLSHTARLYDFISRYCNGEPLPACYDAKDKKLLINFKKQLDWDGNPMSKETAIELEYRFVEMIKEVKDANLTDKDELNIAAVDLLEKLKYNIIKEKLKREIEDERGKEVSELLEG